MSRFTIKQRRNELKHLIHAKYIHHFVAKPIVIKIITNIRAAPLNHFYH